LVSFTFLKNQPGEIVTVAGDRPEDCALRAQQLEAAAIGVNCGRDLGMNEIIEVVHRYRDKLGDALPIFARPNAGTPRRIDGHWVYPQTAELMARRLSELFAAGVKMIGGCCGTTPEHIAAFNAVVYDWNASKRSSASDRA
jgi:5-methyltetrahydrofolate--homocysteine methyltransferase